MFLHLWQFVCSDNIQWLTETVLKRQHQFPEHAHLTNKTYRLLVTFATYELIQIQCWWNSTPPPGICPSTYRHHLTTPTSLLNVMLQQLLLCWEPAESGSPEWWCHVMVPKRPNSRTNLSWHPIVLPPNGEAATVASDSLLRPWTNLPLQLNTNSRGIRQSQH